MDPNQLESSQVYPSSWGFPKHQSECEPLWQCDNCGDHFSKDDLRDYEDLLVCYKCEDVLLSMDKTIDNINNLTKDINK